MCENFVRGHFINHVDITGGGEEVFQKANLKKREIVSASEIQLEIN